LNPLRLSPFKGMRKGEAGEKQEERGAEERRRKEEEKQLAAAMDKKLLNLQVRERGVERR
jgi:hypothetical protein